MKKYSSYKDSGVDWISQIPKHWSLTKMKHVGEYINGYPFKPKDWGEKGKLIIRIQNLTKGNSSENFYDGDIDEKYIIKKGDLLFSWSTTLGLFEWNKSDGVLNQHIFKVQLNHLFVKRFYYWVIQGVIKYLDNESHGSTMTHLTKGVFGNVKLPITNKDEQEQIVSFLDDKTQKIGFLIEHKQKKIELLKEKRTSLINHIITKGLNPKVEMKDSGVEWIGEIPSHWEMKKVKYLFEIRKRISGELGYDVLSVTQKGLKVKDIVSGKGQVSMDYTKYQIVNEDDFVMNHMDLLTGYVDVSKQLGVTSPDYRVFTLTDKKSNKDYYLSIFQFGYKNKIFYGSGQGSSMLGRWRLPSRQFNQFKFPYPSMKEQQQIVEYLDKQTEEIETLIQLEQKKIDTLKEYRQSLISEVVTGKIRVCEEDNSLSLNSQTV